MKIRTGWISVRREIDRFFSNLCLSPSLYPSHSDGRQEADRAIGRLALDHRTLSHYTVEAGKACDCAAS